MYVHNRIDTSTIKTNIVTTWPETSAGDLRWDAKKQEYFNMGIIDKLVNPEKIIDEKALVEAAIVGLRELLKEGLTISAQVGGVSVVAEISLGKEGQ